MEATTPWQAVGIIFTLSLFVEAIVEYFSPSFPTTWKWTKMYVGAAVAMLVALAYNADLPATMGLPALPYVGPILTGLVIGRGSNFLSTFYKRQQVVRVPAEPVAHVLSNDLGAAASTAGSAATPRTSGSA